MLICTLCSCLPPWCMQVSMVSVGTLDKEAASKTATSWWMASFSPTAHPIQPITNLRLKASEWTRQVWDILGQCWCAEADNRVDSNSVDWPASL